MKLSDEDIKKIDELIKRLKAFAGIVNEEINIYVFNKESLSNMSESQETEFVPTINIPLLDAVNIIELMQSGTFPLNAMSDGKYLSFERFKSETYNIISSGDF